MARLGPAHMEECTASAVVLACARAPRQLVARALTGEEGGPQRCQGEVARLLRIAKEHEDLIGNVVTPYGPIIKTTELDAVVAGQSVTLEYICPRAWLYTILQIDHVRAFLNKHIPNRVGSIAWYNDEVKPGNNMRPDVARTYLNVYYCIVQLPDWFRVGLLGWWDMCCVSLKDLHTVKGGLAAVTNRLLEIFDFPMRVTVRTTGAEETWELNWECMCADEKAVKGSFGVVGASGYKCCAKCRNVYARLPADADEPYLRHYTCLRPEEFDLYTHANHVQACEAVRQARLMFRASDAEYIETLYGIQYVGGNSIFFNTEHRARLNLPYTIFFDSMHSLFASGGTGQYSVNQFLLRVMSLGVSMDLVQQLFDTIHNPGNVWRLDLKCRIKKKAGACMRGFASETLCVVTLCALICDDVVGHLLPLNAEFIRELFNVAFLIQLSDGVVPHAALALTSLLRFDELLLRLYPKCAKIKVHLAVHAVLSIMQHQFNINCFAPERKHRLTKTICSFSYNHHSSTNMRRSISHTLAQMGHPQWFTEYRITKPWSLKTTPWDAVFSDAGLRVVEQGSCMACGKGSVSHHSFLIWRSDDNSFLGARVDHVAMAVRAGADPAEKPSGFVLIIAYNLVTARYTPCSWLFESRHAQPFREVIHASKVITIPPWVHHGKTPDGKDRVRALVPPVFGQIHGL